MHFEWDEEKNKINIRKHGLDFADAWEMFEGPIWMSRDHRFDYEEDRWTGIGSLGNRTVAVAFTERGDEVIRIISFRKASKNERAKLERTIKNRLGQD